MRLYQLEDWSHHTPTANIFGKKDGVEVCTNRFDDDTKEFIYRVIYKSLTACFLPNRLLNSKDKRDINSQMDDNDSQFG